jgi:hypothetical protein
LLSYSKYQTPIELHLQAKNAMKTAKSAGKNNLNHLRILGKYRLAYGEIRKIMTKLINV